MFSSQFMILVLSCLFLLFVFSLDFLMFVVPENGKLTFKFLFLVCVVSKHKKLFKQMWTAARFQNLISFFFWQKNKEILLKLWFELFATCKSPKKFWNFQRVPTPFLFSARGSHFFEKNFKQKNTFIWRRRGFWDTFCIKHTLKNKKKTFPFPFDSSFHMYHTRSTPRSTWHTTEHAKRRKTTGLSKLSFSFSVFVFQFCWELEAINNKRWKRFQKILKRRQNVSKLGFGNARGTQIRFYFVVECSVFFRFSFLAVVFFFCVFSF